jgi:hypothetical protein
VQRMRDEDDALPHQEGEHGVLEKGLADVRPQPIAGHRK